uniref:AIG1-type G domain-containing protein n=1 Tax=Hippocampus comes TaxID=109280 RepID=A0A3Q2Y6S7_HIPCM
QHTRNHQGRATAQLVEVPPWASRLLAGPAKKLKELRILILGEKLSGKTTAGNCLLRGKVFPAQPNDGCMAWKAQVADMQVTVVDTPGWCSESDCTRQQDREIVRGLTLSPQGFDAVLIVISLDFKFDQVSLDTLQDHIKLFGDSIWNHTMLLFTNQDTLGDRSLEEFIEGEDRPLRWLVDKCGNTYHCLHVTDQTDISQHYELFEKIEGMSAKNQGRLFRPDMKDGVQWRGQTVVVELRNSTVLFAFKLFPSKKREIRKINHRRGLQLNDGRFELRILILGEKLSGKTTAGNCLLRGKVFPAQPNDGCMAWQGQVAGMQVTVVDTPGWYSESDCTQQQDREIVRGLTLSPQGFDAVLIVISLDFKFDQVSLDTLQDHIKLFGDSIWNHTMLLFTNQDTLGDRSLEEFIEGEDRPLRWLVDKCGNTYHCLHVTDQTDISQHYELFEKIEVPCRNCPPKKLKELRILILGEKLSGKTTAANFLLRGKVFPAQPNDGCMAKAGPGGGVQVTVVDTPGWYSESDCTQQQDREIVRGLTLSPQGFDAVLIVISLDFKFDQVSLDTLQDHIKLFGDSIWNHTMLLFTNQDTLGDRSLEEFIEGEDRPLRWLVDKCGNTYHCLHVTDQTDISQHYELFEKIEGMSAKNQDIENQIQGLNANIMKSMGQLRSSMDFGVPSSTYTCGIGC